MGSPQLNEKDTDLIVQNLKLLRQTMKWTQDDLAKRVGVTRQTITSIENGKTIPSKTLALAILGLFTSLAFIPVVGIVIKAVLDSTNLNELWKRVLKGEE
ncbi:helix-turn-helix domain-containing protein [Bacillus infantis]|uniref:helix-turn-helix transcriptional regulator n=1 Tax=Bacillus infantis TaxID=324767 RepID=UPI002004AF4F|nr:helix-turn-helix domain-containing protein [Bacillus infantis]MCK6207717.1 helix-turn-helix domain-containing protein [Bacillus infantis]